MRNTAGSSITATSLCDFLRKDPGRLDHLRGTDGSTYSTDALLDAVTHISERAEKSVPGGVADRVIGLQDENGPQWVIGLLGLLGAGAHPLLVGPEAPAPEAHRLLREARADGWLQPATGSIALTRTTPPSEQTGRGTPTIVLATSGSTGRPSLVHRTEADLITEGLRYRDGVGVGPKDQVLLPLPLSHSYALGWLFGALLAGAAVVPTAPTALGSASEELVKGATVIALVPSLARLLSHRVARRPEPRAPSLRIAMVGAGPVDDELEGTMRDAFGIPTARNYGSTETGTLCAGVPDPAGPGLPTGCVGKILPGVEYEIHPAPGDDSTHDTGLLRVRTGRDSIWHETGDVVTETSDGLKVLGRRSNAVRRGDRWVSSLEVESVLREHPAVLDAHVIGRPGRHAGTERLIADVVLAQGTELGSVRSHLTEKLAPAKRPDELRERDDLWRTTAGKVPALPRLRITAPGLAKTRAYKASELLFALRDLGVFELLDGNHDVVDLARKTGCHANELARLLDVAADLGLVRAGDEENGAEIAIDEAIRFVDLESALSRSWTSRSAIAELARDGSRPRRPFEDTAPHPEFTRVYQRAMEAPSTHARRTLGTRLARVPHGARILEVTAGPGRYLPPAINSDPAAAGHLVPIGSLSGTPHPALLEDDRVEISPDPPANAFDICVVANAIHGPAPGDDLDWLLSRVRPGGKLLVDDLFLPDDGGPGSELALDWCTHGGTSWPRLPPLVEALTARGADVGRPLSLPGGVHALVVAGVPETSHNPSGKEK